jgi:septum formation topological specificity factor MinE
MGAQCFKAIEVIAVKDVETYLVPKILEELKFKIIPVIINQLQFTEDKIDVSENKMSSINIE